MVKKTNFFAALSLLITIISTPANAVKVRGFMWDEEVGGTMHCCCTIATTSGPELSCGWVSALDYSNCEELNGIELVGGTPSGTMSDCYMENPGP